MTVGTTDVRWAEDNRLGVSEVFGPVYQGEGPYAGRRCHFLRLMRCNLTCAWCDTPFTWDADRYDLAKETTRMKATEILDKVGEDGLVVLSGGEPLLWQRTAPFKELLTLLVDSGNEVHCETNGTIYPTAENIRHYSVSPKLFDQGDPISKRIKHEPLTHFADLSRRGKAIFKLVVANEAEVAEASRFFETLDIPQHARWVMPEGRDAQTILDRAAAIEDTALHFNLNLTLRQHVLMHGDQRGY